MDLGIDQWIIIGHSFGGVLQVGCALLGIADNEPCTNDSIFFIRKNINYRNRFTLNIKLQTTANMGKRGDSDSIQYYVYVFSVFPGGYERTPLPAEVLGTQAGKTMPNHIDKTL